MSKPPHVFHFYLKRFTFKPCCKLHLLCNVIYIALIPNTYNLIIYFCLILDHPENLFCAVNKNSTLI